MANIKDAITAVNKEFMEAFNTKTASWLAKLYAPEALLLPPGVATISGEENICKFWQGVIDMGICDIDLETVSLDEADATVTEVGQYRLHNETTVADQGKYLVVWKQIEGEWRLYRDIWNSDPQPADASEAPA
ncbi:MAG: DUF4440 domain-containing protein [Acidobacteriaceae bacterium]